MDKKRKGAVETTPEVQEKYNRLVNLCLAIECIGIVVTIVGKYINNDRMMMAGVGMMIAIMVLNLEIVKGE